MKRLSLRFNGLSKVTETVTSGAAILVFSSVNGHHAALNMCYAKMGKGTGRDKFGNRRKEIK